MEAKRCAIYARVSSQEQADKDLSIPAQLNALRSYAARKGWEIIEEFIDVGVSGNLTTWRTIGTNHHMTLTTEQIK